MRPGGFFVTFVIFCKKNYRQKETKLAKACKFLAVPPGWRDVLRHVLIVASNIAGGAENILIVSNHIVSAAENVRTAAVHIPKVTDNIAVGTDKFLSTAKHILQVADNIARTSKSFRELTASLG